MIEATDIAAARAAAGGRRLVDVLEERLALGADEFAARLAATFRLEPLRMDEMRRLDPAFDLVPFAECSQKGCVALRDPAQGLLLATDDPFSAEQEAWAAERLREPFAWRLVYRGDLVAYLASHEETLRALDSLREEAVAGGESERAVEDLSLKSISDETSEVVRLVRSTLRDALKIGASDIHLESLPSGLAIKFRIDGILSQIKLIEDRAQAEQAIARVKVLAELDITERRVPQDGRFKAAERGRAVDFRVSIMPSIHGEDAVLRILDKQSLYETTQQQLSLGSLGFEERDIRVLRRLSREPYGMLLVTGPTGSGKTTTLYAALSEVNRAEDKIVTIEDPVEYQLRGITQIPINEKKGLTFARGLRSILRHDPDKIMVGEIRDPETAQIAIQSALTGHLVFTTVHANNVVDVLGRFLNMGVEPYQFVSALNCVMAQRLVRLICARCKRPVRVAAEALEEAQIDPALAQTHQFYEGAGCIDCGGTGFKGRTAICELLDLSDRIREMILARRPASDIKKAAHEEGMRFLRESAVEKVLDGLTTLREINKVTFVE